uniref:Uncharacterized protein n=1 Tax=Anguilla anguilla TaxID=7936 RepID=A0A0E9TI00_ANGAN
MLGAMNFSWFYFRRLIPSCTCTQSCILRDWISLQYFT